jgi:hypothetical protein
MSDYNEAAKLLKKINACKKELLDFIHRIGCKNITYRHIDYLYDNVDRYSSRIKMIEYLIREDELIGVIEELDKEDLPVTSGHGETEQ